MQDYSQTREMLRQRLVHRLQADERFVAAWLFGSYGRGDQDAWSDLDVAMVVTDEAASVLCARPWQVGAGTTPDRLALYTWLGQPAIIHENHNNALPGGTAAVVWYATALNVDWFLVPQSQARRHPASVVLFDRVGIPLQPPPTPESLEERVHKLSERVAFFWMMAAVTAKYWGRGDGVAALIYVSWLHEMTREVDRLVAGEAWVYQKAPRVPLATTPASQAEAIRAICRVMLTQMPHVVALGGQAPQDPMAVVEQLLALRSVQDPPGAG